MGSSRPRPPTLRTIEMFGARWKATERPFGPPRPLGFSAALAFDALELECNRTMRRAVGGLLLLGAALTLLVVGARGSTGSSGETGSPGEDGPAPPPAAAVAAEAPLPGP